MRLAWFLLFCVMSEQSGYVPCFVYVWSGYLLLLWLVCLTPVVLVAWMFKDYLFIHLGIRVSRLLSLMYCWMISSTSLPYFPMLVLPR